MAFVEKIDRKEFIILLIILLLAAYLRLANVSDNPGWYTDEATHLDILRHAMAGKTQYLAITQSVLLFSRLPLLTAVLVPVATLFGVSMTMLRMVTGCLGVLSVGLMYGMVRSGLGDRALALVSSLLLAIYPAAVVYSRFGFSYNLLVPLLLLTLWGLWRYWENGRYAWLLFSAICLGLGLVTDLLAIAFVPVWLGVVAWRNWRVLWWSGLLLVLPFGLYAAISLIIAPEAFLFDWQFVFSRLSPGLSQQIGLLAENGVTLLSQNIWLALGFLGLFFLRPTAWRNMVLAFVLVPFVILGRTTPLFSLSFYYMIPFLPFAALGVASLLLALLRFIWPKQVWVKTAVLVLVVGLIGWQAVQVVGVVNGRLTTAIDPFLLPAADVEAVTAFVNERIQPEDLVIGSPTVVWMVNGRSADFQMMVAADGVATPHLPANLPPDRWAFDPTIQQAKFVIVDPLWRRWAVPHVPGVVDTLKELETWPIVFESGEIQVFENNIASPLR